MSNSLAHLRSFVQRIERLDSEIADLNADKKEVFAEARGTGFDVKIMKLLIAERRKDQADLAEQNELLDLYRAAMSGTEDANVRVGAPARETQPATPHNPETGEIIELVESITMLDRFGNEAAAPGAPDDSSGTGAAAPQPTFEPFEDDGLRAPETEHELMERAKIAEAFVASIPAIQPKLPAQVHRTVTGGPLSPPVEPDDLEALTLLHQRAMPDIPEQFRRAPVAGNA